MRLLPLSLILGSALAADRAEWTGEDYYDSFRSLSSAACPLDGVFVNETFTTPPSVESAIIFPRLGSSIEYISADGADVLVVNQRTNERHGVEIDLSSFRSCLAPQTAYTLTARVRLKSTSDGSPTTCANSGEGCLAIKSEFMNSSGGVTDYVKYAEEQSRQITYGEFWTISTEIEFEAAELIGSNAYHALRVEGAVSGVDIEIDDIVLRTPPPTPEPSSAPSNEPSSVASSVPTVGPSSLPSERPSEVPSSVPTETDCTDLIYNGDFGAGTMRWTDLFGENLTLVEGFDGAEDYAIEDSGGGLAQYIKIGCLKEDKVYEVHLKYKLKDSSGNDYACSTECPTVLLETTLSNSTGDKIIAHVAGLPYGEGWSKMFGMFTATAMDADPSSTLRINVNQPVDGSIIVDDVSISEKPKLCNGELTANSDMELGHMGYWDTYGKGSLEPYGGTGSLALLFTGRTSTKHGPQFAHHMLDVRCLEADSEWEIEADFKLLESATNIGANCNTSYASAHSDACPSVKIWIYDASNPTTAIWKKRIFKGAYESIWNPVGFNKFKDSFTVPSKVVEPVKAAIIVRDFSSALNIVVDNFVIKKKALLIPMGPTLAPVTPSPTLSATQPTLGFPKLLKMGSCTSENPCDKCVGDCAGDDTKCRADLGLVCYSRNESQPVVGCVSGGSEDKPGVDYCYKPPANGSVTYIPGDLTVFENGLMLSTGLTSRIIAQEHQKVTFDFPIGSQSTENMHADPDGAAIFHDPDTGWFRYVSNAESKSQGGVGALIFNSNAEVVGYERLVPTNTTKRNCGGGKTFYGTWLTCEETEGGQVWEIDPYGVIPPRKTIIGGENGDEFESAAYDNRDPANVKFFITADREAGPVHRFTPDEQAIADAISSGNYTNLLHTNENGTAKVEYLVIKPYDPLNPDDGTFTWTDNLTLAEESALAYYKKPEGIDIRDGICYFTCKGNSKLFILDLDSGTYESSSTDSGAFDRKPDQVARLINGDDSILYFCEDGKSGSSQYENGVHGRDAAGNYYTILENTGFNFTGESTGLAFSPDSRHMYVSFQGPGYIFDITRTDGYPFDGQRLDIKYHNLDNHR